MRRVLKTVLWTLVFVPVTTMALFAALNGAQALANRFMGKVQTGTVERNLTNIGAEIVERYSFVGNSNGMGNHVDLYTAFLVRTEENVDTISDCIEQESHIVVHPYCTLTEREFEKYNQYFVFPTDTEQLFVVEVTSPAPFPTSF